jgi:cell wall-associated NlpC family hydrolase
METWRDSVETEARRWLLTPWHHNARVLGHGVDCAQLLIAVYTGAGLVEPFDVGRYPTDWMMHSSEEKFLGWIEQYMDRVAIPQRGDAAVWKFGHSYSHGAVVTSWPEVVHAYRPARMVCLGNGEQGRLAWLRDGVRRSVVFYTPKGAR